MQLHPTKREMLILRNEGFVFICLVKLFAIYFNM